MPVVTCTVAVREGGVVLQHFPLTVRSESYAAVSGVVTERATLLTSVNQPVTTVGLLFLQPLDQALTLVESFDVAATRIALNPTGMLLWFGASVTGVQVSSSPDGELRECVGGTTAL